MHDFNKEDACAAHCCAAADAESNALFNVNSSEPTMPLAHSFLISCTWLEHISAIGFTHCVLITLDLSAHVSRNNSIFSVDSSADNLPAFTSSLIALYSLKHDTATFLVAFTHELFEDTVVPVDSSTPLETSIIDPSMVANTDESLSFLFKTAFSTTSPLAVVCFSNGVFFVPSNAANKSSGLNDSNSSASSSSDAFGAACECTLTWEEEEEEVVLLVVVVIPSVSSFLAADFFSGTISSSSSFSATAAFFFEDNPSFPLASACIRSTFSVAASFCFAFLSSCNLFCSVDCCCARLRYCARWWFVIGVRTNAALLGV
mmetsp:Transcript_6124/g.19238  ORF Transcript_6124/g.19238 Transcript_6124/m.19238 type:complete len:317 (-) Transcript_6124:201-1151(-)